MGGDRPPSLLLLPPTTHAPTPSCFPRARLFAVSAIALRGAGGAMSLQGLSAAAIALWSIKLASFLFVRVLGSGHDARLDDMLGAPGPAAGFW